jgi:hypothetical protein
VEEPPAQGEDPDGEPRQGDDEDEGQQGERLPVEHDPRLTCPEGSEAVPDKAVLDSIRLGGRHLQLQTPVATG